jgi:spore germination cell wall hydrolase CwlJ-like protein
MKLIITENQLKTLIKEIENPCPKGTTENELITLSQVENGSVIKKGYCNTNKESAIVKIQLMLQNKGLLDVKNYNGYYGDKTQNAIKKLFEPEVIQGTMIGKKTLEKLKTYKTSVNKINSKPNNISEKESEKLFNSLSTNEKKLVCTLLGEAGGESNPIKGMTAVANVLQNRAKNNHYNFGGSAVEQALYPSQFSMWNKYNKGSEKLQNVYDKYKKHGQMKNAIDIVKSIGNLKDITGGAKFYYANYVSPNWSKETNDSIFVKTATIGKHIFGNILKKKK